MNLTKLAGEALMVLIPMILSLTVHEFSHAFAAAKLGDNTAELEGRLTLNPISHIDPMGTLLLPFMLLMAGGAMGTGVPFFGWAKPVPMNAGRFRRTISVRFGSLVVAGVGPLSNLFMALLCAGIRSLALHHVVGGADMPEALDTLLSHMVLINIGLFVFNLIPISPLDGQKVVAGLLPPAESLRFERFNDQFGRFALLAIVFFAGRVLITPVVLVAKGVYAVVGLS